MERLTIDEVIEHCNRQTERMENNFGRSQLEEKPMMGNLNIMKHYWEHRQVAEWLKELKEYRDLEEQGRLIKLPCNVGEEVWIIEDINCLIHKGKVESFTRDQHFNRGWLAEIKIAEGVISSCWERFEDFGKNVFLTKEEAEKALEEIGE